LEGKTFSISDKVLSVSNNLKIDLMNATLDNDNKILVWMAMPAIGDAYGSFKAVVKDSEGNLYIGKLLAKDSTPFVKSITRNSRTTVRVNEFDLVDGFQGGIEDWVNDAQDYGGIAN
jgi:hypothetical protein